MGEAERRRAPRSSEALPLAVTEGDVSVGAKMQNLSAAGAYVSLERFIPPMTKLELKFDLPGGARPAKVQCAAVVVRVEPSISDGDVMRYNTALFFTDLAERDRKAISQFVERRLAGSRKNG